MKNLFYKLAARLGISSMCLLTACTSLQPNSSAARVNPAAADLPLLTDIFALCQTAKTVEIFEGLPHPRFEAALLKQESTRPDTFENHGFRFYSPALGITELATLRELASKAESFKPWQGERFCGGFHPDFLLRFHCANEIIELQLCEGCGEARLFVAPKVIKLDLSDKMEIRLKSSIATCRTKRPVRVEARRPSNSHPNQLSINAIDALLEKQATQP